MKRTLVLPQIRASRTEIEQIRRFAEIYNLSVSQYVRLSALQLLREEGELQKIYAQCKYKA